MDMILELILAAALCAALTLIYRRVGRAVFSPLPRADGAEVFTVVAVTGQAEQLEQLVGGLLWLGREGTLRGRIVIADCGLADGGRKLAELMARDNSAVTVCTPEEFTEVLEENGWTEIKVTYK
ncbi:MAG: hypothetical protein LBT12_07095 [Oscillospiraceae bacterium]|jgi:hypothetical protein|nr:hypothetical protein [Oscillospiraceae bacterium]